MESFLKSSPFYAIFFIYNIALASIEKWRDKYLHPPPPSNQDAQYIE